VQRLQRKSGKELSKQFDVADRHDCFQKWPVVGREIAGSGTLLDEVKRVVF